MQTMARCCTQGNSNICPVTPTNVAASALAQGCDMLHNLCTSDPVRQVVTVCARQVVSASFSSSSKSTLHPRKPHVAAEVHASAVSVGGRPFSGILRTACLQVVLPSSL